MSLSRYCGANDSVGELSTEFDDLRKGIGVYSRNHFMGGRPVPAHATAKHIFNFVGPKVWHSYAKIATERHPYDRLLSHYYHLKSLGEIEEDSFENFIFSNLWIDQRIINRDRLMLGMTWAPDYLLKFEQLERDLRLVMHDLNVPFDGWLPRLRVGPKKDKSLLTSKIKDRIWSENKIIFQKLNYKK